jgi:hypothetical protein
MNCRNAAFAGHVSVLSIPLLPMWVSDTRDGSCISALISAY